MDKTPTATRKRIRPANSTTTPTSTSRILQKRRRLADENDSPTTALSLTATGFKGTIDINSALTLLHTSDSSAHSTSDELAHRPRDPDALLQYHVVAENAEDSAGSLLGETIVVGKKRGRPPKALMVNAALTPMGPLGDIGNGLQMQQQISMGGAAPFPNMSPRKGIILPPDSPLKSPMKSPLKGILTPSRKGRGLTERTRKNVVFDMGGGNKTPGELVFEDLPGTNSASGKRARILTPAREGEKTTPLSEKLRKASKKRLQLEEDIQVRGEAEKHEEREVVVEEAKARLGTPEEQTYINEVCQICNKGESIVPNEILFCDVCDLGYHQVCHGIKDIPQGDWLCINCAQENITKTPSAKRYANFSLSVDEDELAEIEEPDFEIPDIINFDYHLKTFQRVLVDRCTGRRRIKLIGQEEPMEKTYQLIQQTVISGEGNSMLIIGARGSGKTTMVESVVSDMMRHYPEDFHTVRLNGFIHTDDKLALKEIWRQLGVEMEVDDAVMKRTSYADTLASLLALLSHPTEITGPDAEGTTSKSVIFVIDEFDMFAYHPRQTLLYNLFDIAQARKAPIGVIGCTTRLDVVDMLEKRVKSRFSHRYVYMMPPRSLPGFWEVCRQGLLLDDDDILREGLDPKVEGFGEFQTFWLNMVQGAVAQEDFQKVLKHHYYSAKDVPGFLAACLLPLALLRGKTMPLRIPAADGLEVGQTAMVSSRYSTEEPNSIVATQSLAAPPSKTYILPSLSDLDLSLLIAAARLDIVAHTDTVNFAMAYDEYAGLVGRQRVQAGVMALNGGARVWGRGVAGIAWERLVNAGLLVPASVGGRGQMGGLESKMWKVDMALEDIPVGVKLSEVMAKWCREI